MEQENQLANLAVSVYEEFIGQNPNLHDVSTLMKLSVATLITTLVEKSDADIEEIGDSMRVEMNNVIVEIESTLRANERIKDKCKDKGIVYKYIPLTDKIEYVKNDIILYIDSKTHEIKANRENIGEDEIREAFEFIKKTNAILMREDEEQGKVKEDSDNTTEENPSNESTISSTDGVEN